MISNLLRLRQSLLLIITVINLIIFPGTFSTEVNLEISNLKGTRNFSVNASKGDILQIKVIGNPTTGYGWFILNKEQIKSFVEPINLNEYNSGEFITDINEEGTLGSGGYYLFKFKVKELNTQSPNVIKMINKRPWEKKYYRKISITINSVSK